MAKTTAPERRPLPPDRYPPGPPCPMCGHPLQLITDGLIGEPYHPGNHIKGTPLPVAWVNKPFAACGHCDFCIEIKV